MLQPGRLHMAADQTTALAGSTGSINRRRSHGAAMPTAYRESVALAVLTRVLGKTRTCAC